MVVVTINCCCIRFPYNHITITLITPPSESFYKSAVKKKPKKQHTANFRLFVESFFEQVEKLPVTQLCGESRLKAKEGVKEMMHCL